MIGEHSARLKSPELFDSDTFRRVKGGTIYGSIIVPKSISVLWAKLLGYGSNDRALPQSLRFQESAWNVLEAKQWLKDNNIRYIKFEEAADDKDKDNKERSGENQDSSESSDSRYSETNLESDSKANQEDSESDSSQDKELVSEEKMTTKQYSIREYKEIDDEVIQIMASDESIDRDNDIIRADGWMTDGWLKTGSLLYGHNYSSLPVGSAEGAEIKNKKLYLYSRLAKKGTSEWHDTIRSLIEQNILKGTSVGFKSFEKDENEHGGYTFTKQELLEISLTPIPSNANARLLVKGVSEDIKTKLFESAEADEADSNAIHKDGDNSEEANADQEDRVQDETKDVEPEGLSDREQTFVDTVDLLKSIIGE